MDYYIAYSDKNDPAEAISDIYRDITGNIGQPGFILYFCECDSFKTVTGLIRSSFPDARTIGCSSYIVFSSIGYGKHSIEALALGGNTACTVGVLSDITTNPMKYKENVISAYSNLTGKEISSAADFSDSSETADTSSGSICCFELTSALVCGEELVLDTFHSILGDSVPLFGGSAGNYDGSAVTWVSVNGNIYSNACVFAFIKWPGKIHIFRENIYKPTSFFFHATSVDCDKRCVYEFDDIPAGILAARALNVTPEELPDIMHSHPLGRIIGDDILITEFKDLNPDYSMNLYARIYTHTKLVLMEPDNCLKVFKRTADEIHKQMPKRSFCIAVNCFSRSKLFESSIGFDKFADTLRTNVGDYVGFSGYGEQIGIRHLNQTLILAVFE